MLKFNKLLNDSLINTDPLMKNLLEEELKRQREGLELIASENFTSQQVMECLGSVLTNKYAEGYPNMRYYGGCDVVDKVETICQERALKLYKLNEEIDETSENINDMKWGVNVQPYSGSIANMTVYVGLLKPHDRIMGLDLPSGGHLTHGFYTKSKKVSATSVFYESLPYSVNEDGYIDYDKLEEMALIYKPKLIICGYSAYSRELNYKRFREIADKCGSYLMCDMAHISGLVATGMLESPFKYCDIVTTTTHKTLRGPRAGMIFYKLKYKQQIDQALFPGLQGGPHINKIAGVATQLLQAETNEFKEYIKQVINNSRRMANNLIEKGYKIQTNGTDNHIILLNLKDLKLSGSKVENICNMVGITINKNSVPGDKSALNPSGIRLGSSSLTSRNMNEKDFDIVSDLLDEAINLTLWINNECINNNCINNNNNINKCSMKEFNNYINNNENVKEKVIELKEKVVKFAKQFPLYETNN